MRHGLLLLFVVVRSHIFLGFVVSVIVSVIVSVLSIVRLSGSIQRLLPVDFLT